MIVFLSSCIIIIPKIIQNGKVVPEIFHVHYPCVNYYKRLQWKWVHKDTEQSRFWPFSAKYEFRDTPLVYNTITAFLLSHFIIIQKIIKNDQAVLDILNFEKSSDLSGWECLAQKTGEGIFFLKNLIRPLFTPYIMTQFS